MSQGFPQTCSRWHRAVTSSMLAVRASPDIHNSSLFLDTPGSGPSTASLTPTHLIDPSLAGPSSPVKRATKSRSRSTTPAGEKRYKCQYEGCEKAYTKPSRLAEHELSHTGEVRLGPLTLESLPLTDSRYSDGTLARTATTLT